MDKIFKEDPLKNKVQIAQYNPRFRATLSFIDTMITPDSPTKQCTQCKYNLDTSWFMENPHICHMCIQDNQAKEEE